MKGKKFTAAEKHFQEKEVKLRKDIQYWQELAISRAKYITELETALRDVTAKVSQQQDWIERLLQYTELSQADIKAACEKDKQLAACADLILGASKFWRF